VRALVGVVVVGLTLAALAGVAVRGARRIGWSDGVDQVGRTTLQTVVEGLIVIAAIIIGVVIVVALAD
jgi:L-lactate permease